jgi:hypothetical protein
MRIRYSRELPYRILIIRVSGWGLLMIVPDLYRVAVPLSSAGLAEGGEGRTISTCVNCLLWIACPCGKK